MAKLVIGTNKQTVVPAVVRDLSPEIYRVFRVNNGTIENSVSTPFLSLPSTATDISHYCYYAAYKNTPASVLYGTIDLSSLTTISGISACNDMFYGCTGITSVDLSSLTTTSGQYACVNMFQGCTGITSIDLSSLTTISGNDACRNMFYGCTGITSVDLGSLTTISAGSACIGMFQGCTGITSIDLTSLTTISAGSACNDMFQGCTGITSVDLSSLTTVKDACIRMFGECTGITSVDLSSLTTITGGNACSGMFQGCTRITSIDLSSLTTISGNTACSNMFRNCSGLTTAKFNALNSITQQIAPGYSQVFPGCTTLESVEFGGLTASTFAYRKDQIAYLFNNTTGSAATNGCTVHFPSNFDPSDPNHTFDASTLTGYPTFGGSASYIHVAFDLPATE